MASKSTSFIKGLLALTLATSGACGGEVSGMQAEAKAANALTINALTINALTINALTINALTINALTINALTINALTINALRDPAADQFMKYLVSCALPAGAKLEVPVDDEVKTYSGGLGLAPEWGVEGGSCGPSCQRWVSACLMARVDAEGVERDISVRGEHRALQVVPHEMRDYPVREATYFGNIFDPGEDLNLFACLPPGANSVERVCGPSLADCPMTVVGSCEVACRRPGRQQTYQGCSTGGRAGRGETFAETITVFLPR